MKDKPDPRYTITPEIIKDIEETLEKGKSESPAVQWKRQ